MPAAERRIAPIYASMAQSMAALLANYSDEDLALLHDFAAKSARIMAEEIGKLRAKPSAARRKQEG